MPGTRHRMRRALLQAVYAWLMESDAPEEVLDKALDFHEVEADERARAHRLFPGIMANRSSADQVLAQLLEHWSLERMGQVERAVCYLALHELQADPSVPVEVIIDEAVRLGKEYAGPESGHFVNGLLDAAIAIVRPSEQGRKEQA